MQDFLHHAAADVRFALRQLRRNASLCAAAVLCFALGVGANTAIFSVVNAVLFRPLPFKDADQLVLVGEGLPRFGSDNFGVISAPEFVDYQSLNGRVFSSSAIYETGAFAISGSGNPERVTGIKASADFFRMLGVPATHGRYFATSDGQASAPDMVVLSDVLWHRRFGGDPSVVGRTIEVDGKLATVVGVMPPSFQFPLPGIGGEPAEVFIPYKITPALEAQRGNSYNTWLVARLAPGVTIASAKRAVSDLAASLPTLHPGYGKNWKTVADAFPLRDRTTQSVRRPLLILLAAVGMVLLIACINVSSLLLARAAARQREISVRRALGASRARLVQQFLAESVVLVVIGSALGVAFATWVAHALAANAPKQVLQGYDATIDGRVLAALGVVVIIVAVALSIIPAFGQPQDSLGASLHDDARGTTAGLVRQRGRRALVVTQVSLALMLATAAGLMIRSFARARAVDPGFNPEHAITFRAGLSNTRYPTAKDVRMFEQRLLDQLRTLPGVSVASATTNLPMGTPNRLAFAVEGVTMPKIPIGSAELVMPDYFQAMRIPLERGRYLGASDVSSSLAVVVVNESLVKKYFADRDPIGHRVKWGSPESPDPWLTIVGVTADVRRNGLDQPDEPTIYFPALQQGSADDTAQAQGGNNASDRMLRTLSYVVRVQPNGGDLDGVMREIRRVVRASDADLPIIGLQPLANVVDVSVAERRFNTLLLAGFALLALVLASVGIYGLIAYSVVQRTREIGVRLAIGATSMDVMRLVVGQGARLAVVGIAIGLVGAFAVARVMTSLLYEVGPRDPLTFGGAALLLLVVAILASYLPARRAAGIDPQTAIRAE